MFIYNVTIKIQEAIHEPWLQWLKEEHVPEVLASGCFTNATNDDIEDRFEINKNSSLFITCICEESDTKKPNEKLQTKTYFVNIWNEKNKKFNLEKKVIVKKIIKIAGY